MLIAQKTWGKRPDVSRKFTQVEAQEKERLAKMLEEIGIHAFNTRLSAGFLDQRLAQEVRQEHFEKNRKDKSFVKIVKGILSL